MTVVLTSLEPLVAHLRAQGYTVVGPTECAGAIVLGELTNAGDLPHGWGVETTPGKYRLRRQDDRAAFGHSAGPQGWKRFLHPPREALWSAERSDDGVAFAKPESPITMYAFLGVRPCDLRAISVQDRVLGAGTTYAAPPGPITGGRELHRAVRRMFLCLGGRWSKRRRTWCSARKRYRGRLRPGYHRTRPCPLRR